MRLLTDPLLRDRIGPLRWAAERPPSHLADGISGVLVSHLHRDHLDLPSLALISARTPILVPRGAGRVMRRRVRGVVEEMQVGDEVSIGAVSVRAVHAEHDGRRGPGGRPAPALGFVVSGRSTVFFAGDTDLHAGMAELRDDDIGLALLPVGGWGPSLGAGHLDARRAAEALALVRPARAVPIHWGSLRMPVLWRTRPSLYTRPGPDFAAHAAVIAPDVDVVLAAHGERVAVPVRRQDRDDSDP